MEPDAGYVVSGKILSVQAVDKNGSVITQAQQGLEVHFKVKLAIQGDPPNTQYKCVYEVADPDRPGTTWTGQWVTMLGTNGTYSFTSAGFLMPGRDIRFYVTFWREDWTLLAQSSKQTLHLYVPPPPPPPPTEQPPETEPPIEVQPPPPPPPPTEPPSGPPVWQPLRYLIWLLFGQS